MAAASQLLQATHDGGNHHYVFSFTDNAAADLGPVFGLPTKGYVIRCKAVANTGTVKPRLLHDLYPATEASKGEGELCEVPGDAVLSQDQAVYLPYVAKRGKARLHLQGTGTGRTVRVELVIAEEA